MTRRQLTPDLAQRHLSGRKHTLCTYEHPAAVHDIESWERTMRDCGKLQCDPTDLTMDLDIPVRCYHLDRDDGTEEVLYAIGVPNGVPSGKLRTVLASLTVMLTEATGVLRPWYKALHFGRVPTDDNLNILTAHWMGVVQRPSPCGHPVCSVSHACLALNTGSGGA